MRVSPLPTSAFIRTTFSKNKVVRTIRAVGLGSLALTSVSIVGAGCLDRPVAPATPEVTARVVEQVKQNKVNKIDLLFMIDNSSSMADKQSILSKAVPELVKRLIEPKCVNQDGSVAGDAVNNQCAKGALDFEPIKDIHIGIVSSSLGSHGASDVCDDAADAGSRMFPHNNDRGHLISRTDMDAAVPTFANKGFLVYNPSPNFDGGLKTADAVIGPFRSMVSGVGQHGCGYEASLESVYRFLIDPEPYNTITVDGAGSAILSGIDQELLAQRAAFLRSDSLVSVMIVTDENDCSIVDGGQGFYPLMTSSAGGSQLPRGTSACSKNPNDHCCFSCGAVNPPGDCTAPKDDVECQKPARTTNEDPRNLRCFNQKQKYGSDFLYPVQRYIDGFSKTKILNRKNELVDNPLFSDLSCKPGATCQAVRTDNSLIFVAGITGVPWQLIAKNSQDLKAGYKTAEELKTENLWPALVGDANGASPVPPSDLHMVESVTARTGLAGPSSAANADPLHGHEWDPSQAAQPSADLQYACTFPLPVDKVCTTDQDCDCFASQAQLDAMKNPLCQNGNSFSTTQRRAKAYPGTRILQVLQGLDPKQAIVASICPANTMNPDLPDYGYTPAVQALISRLRGALRGRCLPRALEVGDDGKVPCVVIEAFKSPGTCDCKSDPGRKVADSTLLTDDIRAAGDCFCELQQIEDTAAQDLCKTSVDPGSAAGHGWCYIDPEHGKAGNADPRQCGLVAKCPATERRLIKFVDTASEPRSGATAFIMCQEKAFETGASSAQGADVCKTN